VLGTLLRLQWLAFRRAPFLGGRIALVAVRSLGVIYAVTAAALLGFLLPDTLSVWAPEASAPGLVAQTFVPAIAGLTVVRLLFQHMPTRGAEAFLLLPVSRRRVAAALLARSSVSVLNIVPLLFVVPFAARTVRAEFGGMGALLFVGGALALVTLSHLVLVVWKARLGEAPVEAVGTAAVVAAGVAVLEVASGGLLEALWGGSVVLLAVLASGAAVLAFAAYRMVVASMYLDGATQRRARAGRTAAFSCGGTRAFLALDWRLITRNRFPRAIAINAVVVSLGMSAAALLSGMGTAAWLVLVLSTGALAGSFGQYALPYASAHYDGLLAMPGGIRAFARARLLGIAVASVGLGFLTLMLALFLAPAFWLAAPASVLFSAGILGPVAVLGSTLGPKPLDLAEPLMFNYKVQAFGAQAAIGSTFVLIGSVMLPLGPQAGLLFAAGLGAVGLLALPLWMRAVEARLHARRHPVSARFRGAL
jgi:hypothetical protein